MLTKIIDQIPEEYKDCIFIESSLVSDLLEERGLIALAVLVGPSVIRIYDRDAFINNLSDKNNEK